MIAFLTGAGAASLLLLLLDEDVAAGVGFLLAVAEEDDDDDCAAAEEEARAAEEAPPPSSSESGLSKENELPLFSFTSVVAAALLPLALLALAFPPFLLLEPSGDFGSCFGGGLKPCVAQPGPRDLGAAEEGLPAGEDGAADSPPLLLLMIAIIDRLIDWLIDYRR
jgi:hypothetical protein